MTVVKLVDALTVEAIVFGLLIAVISTWACSEQRKGLFGSKEVEMLLGQCTFRDSCSQADDGLPEKEQLDYINYPFILVNSPHDLRLAGITITVVDRQLRDVHPSYYESARRDDKQSIMRTEIDPLDMRGDPVSYFESIVFDGRDLPAAPRRRSLLGQVLLLAYVGVELAPNQKIRTLSKDSDIVRAIMKGFGIDESSVPSDAAGRVLPSELWRTALESQRAGKQDRNTREQGP